MLRLQRSINRPLKIYVESFNDIFSEHSGDIGKTPLLEVDIDTGDSPTYHPKTLHSSLKTY